MLLISHVEWSKSKVVCGLGMPSEDHYGLLGIWKIVCVGDEDDWLIWMCTSNVGIRG